MLRTIFSAVIKDCRRVFNWKTVICIVAGTAIASFGLHNVHQRTGITEGGVLGMLLFLNHWFAIPAAAASPVLDVICYTIAFRILGRDFLKLSALSSVCIAGWFFLWEHLPYLFPDLSGSPFLASFVGALFIGVGVGLVVRAGASSGGDDALAMAISKAFRCRIAVAYLTTDLSVLLLSLSYIPFREIIYSLITVTLSSSLLDLVRSVRLPLRIFGLRTAEENNSGRGEDQAQER